MAKHNHKPRLGAARRRIIQADDPRIDQFGARVVPLDSGCWAFDGNLDDYGTFAGRNAHAWLWRYLHGPVDNGDHIHHRCENKGCVNPAHLERLTPYEHMLAHPQPSW